MKSFVLVCVSFLIAHVTCMQVLKQGDTCELVMMPGTPPSVMCETGLYCHPDSLMCSTITGPCQQKMSDIQVRLAHQVLYGLETPHCEADGNFKGMQLSGSQAVCVTKNGTWIGGYMVNRWETGSDMNCLCARDEYDYKQLGIIGKMYSCEQNGNYASTGCTGSVCYCQDKYGKQVGTSTVKIGQQDSLNC